MNWTGAGQHTSVHCDQVLGIPVTLHGCAAASTYSCLLVIMLCCVLLWALPVLLCMPCSGHQAMVSGVVFSRLTFHSCLALVIPGGGLV